MWAAVFWVGTPMPAPRPRSSGAAVRVGRQRAPEETISSYAAAVAEIVADPDVEAAGVELDRRYYASNR